MRKYNYAVFRHQKDTLLGKFDLSDCVAYLNEWAKDGWRVKSDHSTPTEFCYLMEREIE